MFNRSDEEKMVIGNQLSVNGEKKVSGLEIFFCHITPMLQARILKVEEVHDEI